ncbi:acetyltransferase, partial [Staphylococcus aureus]|nr:acetyltransferase [Staphylococcus aureus]NDQ61654.1 acetyltransferase [Staphylococcus aureus]
MEHSSKEYYEKQSEYWFDEASKFLKQRDELIGDIAKLRERNKELENMWRTLKNELFGRYEFYRFRLSELQIESRAN